MSREFQTNHPKPPKLQPSSPQWPLERQMSFVPLTGPNEPGPRELRCVTDEQTPFCVPGDSLRKRVTHWKTRDQTPLRAAGEPDKMQTQGWDEGNRRREWNRTLALSGAGVTVPGTELRGSLWTRLRASTSPLRHARSICYFQPRLDDSIRMVEIGNNYRQAEGQTTQETSYTGRDFLNFCLLWVFHTPCHHVPRNHHSDIGESCFYLTYRTSTGIIKPQQHGDKCSLVTAHRVYLGTRDKPVLVCLCT